MLYPLRIPRNRPPSGARLLLESPCEGTEGKSMGSLLAEWVQCYNVGKHLWAYIAMSCFKKKHVTHPKVLEGRDHSVLLRGVWWQGPECKGTQVETL